MRTRLSTVWKIFTAFVQKKGAQRLFFILVILASVGFIAFAVYKNWNELQAYQWKLNYKYILASILLFPVGMLPAVAAWHNLLAALGARLRFSKNLRVYAISSLPRHIPGLVWYVTSRTMLYQEQGLTAGIVVAATAAEVFLHAVTGFLMSTMMLFRGVIGLDQYPALRVVIPGAVLLLLALVASPPVVNRLSKILAKRWSSAQVPTLQRGSLLICLIWLFFAWSGGGMLLFLLVRGLHPVSWLYLPVIIGIWALASAIGLTIGIGISGMGLRDVTLGALLSLIIPPITAVVAAVAFRLVFAVGEFIWVSIFAWLIKNVPPETEGQGQDTQS